MNSRTMADLSDKNKQKLKIPGPILQSPDPIEKHSKSMQYRNRISVKRRPDFPVLFGENQ